jgi:hypothetical protein
MTWIFNPSQWYNGAMTHTDARALLECLGVTLLLGVCVLTLCRFNKDAGLDRNMDWHRINGKYRVEYPDIDPRTGKNQISQPMTKAVAQDYAAMFNGRVVPR